MNKLKVYVAGKVSKNSSFGTHYWRDGFCDELSKHSGLEIENLDPTKLKEHGRSPEEIFGSDVYLIKLCDVLIVYLSDDISVGGSQEILIAKYYMKPVIGLAPLGGKFNGATRENFGKVIKNYRDPFVFSTCDIVCDNVEDVAKALKDIDNLDIKSIKIIDKYLEGYLDLAS